MFEDHGSGPPAAVDEAIAALAAALVWVDGASLDGEALMDTVLALEVARRKLDAASAQMLGRLERSGTTESHAGLSTKHWKATRTHASTATVGRELALARTCERFGQLGDALGEGSISADHLLAVDAVCNPRVVDALIEAQRSIVAFAKRHHFRVYVTYLRRLAAMLDEDGAEPDCGDRDSAAMGRDYEGHLHLRLELSGHNAVEVERIINAETDRQHRAARREHDATGIAIPDLAVLRARAVIELLRRGATIDAGNPKPAVEAIIAITVDRDGRPLAAHSIDSGAIDALSAAVLICDAHLQPVVIDETGNPLNLGRTTRFLSTAQRNALIIRDGGCTFPACDQPATRCDAHHEHPWAEGGTTDIGTAALLCRRHHGLVHEDDPWKILHLPIDELPAHLADQHRARARDARLETNPDVRVFRSPTGVLHLAQNHTDHHGPAPP